MIVINHKYYDGKVIYQIMNNTDRKTEYKTYEEIPDKSIISQYYREKSVQINAQQIPSKTLPQTKSPAANIQQDKSLDEKMIQEDKQFFANFMKNSLQPEFESVTKIKTPFGTKLMVMCDNDCVFVSPEHLKQLDKHQFSRYFDRYMDNDDEF